MKIEYDSLKSEQNVALRGIGFDMAASFSWETALYGLLLKEAWQWKLSGHYSDAQILARLSARGLHLLPQKLSKIWRNPFYCGILINKNINEPIQGTWPPLISQGDFKKVQDILERNPSGYQHNKEQADRPLLRLLKCDGCKKYMAGYRNKKKNLHYYCCPPCKGMSVNAHTTPKALRQGADDFFSISWKISLCQRPLLRSSSASL